MRLGPALGSTIRPDHGLLPSTVYAARSRVPAYHGKRSPARVQGAGCRVQGAGCRVRLGVSRRASMAQGTGYRAATPAALGREASRRTEHSHQRLLGERRPASREEGSRVQGGGVQGPGYITSGSRARGVQGPGCITSGSRGYGVQGPGCREEASRVQGTSPAALRRGASSVQRRGVQGAGRRRPGSRVHHQRLWGVRGLRGLTCGLRAELLGL